VAGVSFKVLRYVPGWPEGAWLVSFVVGCTPSTGPTPQSVYQSLVDAGCLAASADGVASLEAEHIRTDQPTWLACMYAGGSVPSCAVPCQ
jgi:hypothetical protein